MAQRQLLHQRLSSEGWELVNQLPTPQPYFPPVIDSTMLSAAECPQKFFLEYVLRRVVAGKSIHLHAGGAMAKAFETIRYEFFFNQRPLPEALELGHLAFLKFWGPGNDPIEMPGAKSYKDYTNCWMAVEAYFKEYPPDLDYFQPYIKHDGTPGVEFRFAVPMQVTHPGTGDPIMFGGRADMLATPRDNPNVCYVLDEKTTASLGANWYKQWDMRGQFYGYTHAGRQMGLPTLGAVVRGIAIQQTQYGFAEVPLTYTNEQLQRWWRNAQRRVEGLVRRWDKMWILLEQNDPGLLPQIFEIWDFSFGELCTSYGGCTYMKNKVCTRADPWEAIRHFEMRIWDPLAHDPTYLSEDRLQKYEDAGPQSFADMIEGLEWEG